MLTSYDTLTAEGVSPITPGWPACAVRRGRGYARLSVLPHGTLPPQTIVTVTVAAPLAQQGDQTGSGDGNGGHDGGGNNS